MQTSAIATFVAPPLLGGLACAIWALASEGLAIPMANLIGAFVFWAVFSVAFEFLALWPMSWRLEDRRHFPVRLTVAGTSVWYLFFVGWAIIFREWPILESLELSLPVVIPGLAVSATFALLRTRTEHA